MAESAAQAIEADPAVRLSGVGVVFERGETPFRALGDVDLAIESGSLVTLIGPSGCGKSTLLRLIADIVQPSEGRIEVFGASPGEIRKRRELGFCFQDATLLPWRSVLDNVRLPLEIARDQNEATCDRPTPEALLNLVGLSDWANSRPAELSGGMRQRVAIARALVGQPRLLLMDEPFGALDEMTRDKLNDELLRIWRETGVTIVFVTHSLAEAVYLGTDIVAMAAAPGRIVECIDLRAIRGDCMFARDSEPFVELMSQLRKLLADDHR